MNTSASLLVFIIDGRRYAVHLEEVERVVPAVEITPLPEGPKSFEGVISIQGKVIPVLNIRKKFRLRERAIDVDDKIVVARGSKWTVALVVDSVEGVIQRKGEEIIPTESILPEMEYTEGVVKIRDDIVFLHDIDKALSLQEKEGRAELRKKDKEIL